MYPTSKATYESAIFYRKKRGFLQFLSSHRLNIIALLISCILWSEIERRSLQSMINDRIAWDGVTPFALHNSSNIAFSFVLTFAEMAVMSLVGICITLQITVYPVKKVLVSDILTTSHERNAVEIIQSRQCKKEKRETPITDRETTGILISQYYLSVHNTSYM